MDWFSWLSRTNLDPSLIYEYGLAFARNELEKEDVPYFNHEFLMSMGISVAKHRLEILKLAKKESGGIGHNLSISNLVLKFNKTKRHVAKRISKWIFQGNSTIKAIPDTTWHQEQWRGAMLRRHKSEKEQKEERVMQKHMRPTLSGPLDMRMHDRLTFPNRSLKLSGPLDSRVQDRLMFTNRSPKLSGPMEGRVQERILFPNKSPRLRLSGPLDTKLVSPNIYSQQNKGKDENIDDDHDRLVWTALFQDMKPT